MTRPGAQQVCLRRADRRHRSDEAPRTRHQELAGRAGDDEIGRESDDHNPKGRAQPSSYESQGARLMRDRVAFSQAASQCRPASRDLYGSLAALLEAATGGVRDLIEAVLVTGARPGDLASAPRNAFDSRTKTLTLSGKTGTRTIPLSPAAVTLFDRLAKSNLPTAPLLTRDDGKAWKRPS